MLNVIRNINLATTMAGGTALTDVTGGLSLRWTYGGITGSKWTDLSGNGNHGYQSGSGTLSDSGSQYGYKFDGSLWFEVPTTTGSLANAFKDATVSGYPFGTGSTTIYYGTLGAKQRDQYLWNRSNVSASSNAGWGHVINLQTTQSSNRAPQDAGPAFGGFIAGDVYSYSIQQLVDAEDAGFVVDTPNFKGSWSFFPSSSASDITLASSSFENNEPVFLIFRSSYVTQQARYPVSGVSVQTSGSATLNLNAKPTNAGVGIVFKDDTQTGVPSIGTQAGNKYLFSRNDYNKTATAPATFRLGKSAYYVSASIGGFTGTLLETRLYGRQLSDSEVYRACNAIRLNLRVTGSFS